MSNKPVLCIQVNEETQLRLLEERHAEDYSTLIERNQEYLRLWIDVEAYEGTAPSNWATGSTRRCKGKASSPGRAAR
jgi:hypothetical protein